MNDKKLDELTTAIAALNKQVENKFCGFAIYTLTECMSMETSECEGNCNKCVRTMYRDYFGIN